MLFFCSPLLSVLNVAAQVPGQLVNLLDSKKLVRAPWRIFLTLTFNNKL